jgi:hypothetical protein
MLPRDKAGPPCRFQINVHPSSLQNPG